jgi:hypothetical protein
MSGRIMGTFWLKDLGVHGRTIVQTHRKINRVGGKGKGKVHPRTGHEDPERE